MTARVNITQKTSAELVIYSHKLGTLTTKPRGDSQQGTENDPPSGPTLLAVETSKGMGETGAWAATVKVPRSMARDWEQSLEDGDWVDITLQRGSRRWHTMRGIVESIEPIGEVSPSGASMLSYSLTGSDFQGIWANTPIWFSTYSSESIVGGAALRASTLINNLFGLGNVGDTVSGILYGFLQVMGGYGRALWPLPDAMPNGGGSSFAEVCARLFDLRLDQPPRIGSAASMMSFENARLWNLATEWAEQEFNEIYCDLARRAPRNAAVLADVLAEEGGSVPYEQYLLREDDALESDQTQMALFLRRRPFPTAEDTEGLEGGPWTSLPTATILPQELEVGPPLHRSGDERVNLIEILPATTQEIAAKPLTLLQSLVDREDIRVRGVRPISMRSRYHANVGVSDPVLAESQRRMVRDWCCLNPAYFSGELMLRTFRPGIRAGMVACVTQNTDRLRGDLASEDLTYYVERVRQSWRAKPNTGGVGRTRLEVTRGFRGGDDALYQALGEARDRFQLLEPSLAAAGPGAG